MKAIKGNKVYTIDEKQKKTYVDAGFDIKDDSGKVIAHGRGKTVPYADFAALQEENKALQEENKALKEKIAELETVAEAEKKTTKKE